MHSPFSHKNRPNIPGYVGRFSNTAKRFGISKLLKKWITTEGEDFEGRGRGVITFSKYLTMANSVSLAHILNFSLMRISEAWSLTVDCLEIEKDKIIGDIYILNGLQLRRLKTATLAGLHRLELRVRWRSLNV